MESLQEYVHEYRKQLDKGLVQKAYRGLMEYMMDLKTHLNKKYPDWSPGKIYHGYMDMTYFPIFPAELTGRKLKIAVVFVHETIQFEVWLAGYNKQIQKEYWESFKEGVWDKYRIPVNLKGVDSIIEYTLVNDPDFDDLDSLTGRIEIGILNFINDVETFLFKH
jgi:hypothetical protein